MDGNEEQGIESCGIPVTGRDGLSIGLGSGRIVAAFETEDKTKVYWCRCSAQQFCAIQELTLRLAAANEGNDTGRDGKTPSLSAKLRSMQTGSNTMGRTSPADDRNA